MFIITDTAHRDCADCRALYDQAVANVQITGSVDATYGTRILPGPNDHWLIVRRAHTVNIAAGIYELAHPIGNQSGVGTSIPEALARLDAMRAIADDRITNDIIEESS